MENQSEIIDQNIVQNESLIEEQSIISINKFVFLSIITFGLYDLWWTYKAWRFFKQKDNLDIMPAIRTLLAIFFLHSLFSDILNYAKDKGYEQSYSPTFAFLGVLVFNAMGRLPDPYWMITIFTFLFMLAPFNALNYAKQNSNDINVKIQNGFNARQIVLIVLGGLLWGLVIIGLMTPDDYKAIN